MSHLLMLLNMPIAAAITGAASLLAGLGSSLFNVGSVNDTNAANAQLARENRNFYYQQWQRENAYNDPSAVMQRLQRAGLNPSLMYGEGAGGLPASATMSDTAPAHMSAPTLDPLMMAQIANISADTALKKTQGEKNMSDIDVNRGIIKVNDSVVAYNSALTNYTKSQQDYVIGQTEMLGTLTEQANSQIALNYATINNMTEQRKIEWSKVALQEKEVNALVEKYGAETGYTQEMIKYYGSLAKAKIANLNKDTAFKDAQINLTDAEKVRVEQDVANLKVINGQLNWDLSLSKKFGVAERELKMTQLATEIVTSVAGASSIQVGPVKDISKENYESLSGAVNHLSRTGNYTP